jgi:hypothetical protein
MIDLDGKYNYSKIISINTKINEQISLYPNPATSFTEIKGLNPNSNLLIYNILGKEILDSKLRGKSIILDTSEFQTGIYFIKNGLKTMKFIKQ